MASQRILSPSILFLICFSLIATACKRNKPLPEFMLKQYEYGAGDALMYENLSENYTSCSWEMIGPDGSVEKTIEGNHPNLVTGILFPNGPYTLRLNALNKKDEASSIEKEFFIKSDRQNLAINMQSGAQGDQTAYTVFVDNQEIGTAGFAGTFSAPIPVGWRHVKLVASSEVKEGLYEFTGSSLSVHLEF